MSDSELLQQLEGKLSLIRDRTRGVALGLQTGMYLWGEGGTSKTYTVEKTLESIGKPFKVTNTRLTGRGLFDLLDEYPDIVHVLDDVETLFSDKNSHCVLRSALWGTDPKRRAVDWQTGPDGRREVIFTGGIILIANCPLQNIPALRALKTRITTLRYRPENEELAALMKSIASKGYSYLNHKLLPKPCLEVADEILKRTANLNRNLDLRLLVTSFQDRIQFEEGHAENHWVDLIESRIQEKVITTIQPLKRKDEEQEFANSISHLPREEKVRVWRERTGKSQASLYRRLGEGSHSQ